jgi:radical SAM protein with 4Fe4S-binding SPASM domain
MEVHATGRRENLIMSASFVSKAFLPDFDLWEKTKDKRVPFSFDLEVTARCNNDCRHCYINLPAGDRDAKQTELSLDEIRDIVGQAVDLGALWCLITGGEPLLRKDFSDIYLALKRKGLLLSVFTNATLVTEEHVALFQKYPPRDIEVTVYGATQETYERVTRRPGSFAAFRRGLDLLLDSGVKVRLKAMALRSNVHELPAIARFCRERTKDYFRFDPLLHLRYDGNAERNEQIRAERLTPEEIVTIERADEERFHSLERGCPQLIKPEFANYGCDHLFHCGAGNGSFNVSYAGRFRLCSSLWDPETVYDLRTGTLAEAWQVLVPQVRDMRSHDAEFLERCRRCPLINLCLWCPAHAYLETGKMDEWVPYFCSVTHARAEALKVEAVRNGSVRYRLANTG